MRIQVFAAALLLSAAGIASAQSTALTTQQYTQTNLVADSTSTAAATTIDPNLVGGWGLSRATGGPWWVADNGSGLSTLYNGIGTRQSLVVTVPSADPNKNPTGTPTGIVFNSNPSNFILADGRAATFLFATLDGLIAGWNSAVPNNISQIGVNQAATSSFYGLAVTQATINGTTSTYLYATDFKQRKVNVFDTRFNHVTSIENAIASIGLPGGTAPFGIQAIGANLYVTLAAQNADGTDQQNGPGLGLVAAITPEGKFIGNLEGGPFMNAPWGVAIAPGDFGLYSHDLLVSNNGSGEIDIFNPITGKYIDKLRDTNNAPININGIWGIGFGTGAANNGPANTLYFAAQPDAGGGLFGTLTAVQNPFGNSN